MKKLISILLAAMLVVGAMAGCGGTEGGQGGSGDGTAATQAAYQSQSIDVEGLGNGLVFGARFADCLGKIKFCHRLHHTFLYAFFIFCHGASYGFRTILNFSTCPHARSHPAEP